MTNEHSLEENKEPNTGQKSISERIFACNDETLKIVKDIAERANRSKSDFLSGISHELRTPLNSIIGFSEVLQAKFYGDLNEKQEKYINNILESGRYLLGLINDMIDIAKTESGKMELRLSNVNLKSLLENSLIMIKERCYIHNIQMQLIVPLEMNDLVISVDERKLKQIIFNLLSNAVKFTPDGGKISINIRKDNKNILFSVSDSGIGIPKEDQELIFQEFFQIRDDPSSEVQGMGLGLSLAKKLVDLHGGKIWVESEGKGRGSTFYFNIPIRDQARAANS